jgi:bisphosphoglycerate-independent phosphoglycerate mutase (AlkP superfamily)
MLIRTTGGDIINMNKVASLELDRNEQLTTLYAYSNFDENKKDGLRSPKAICVFTNYFIDLERTKRFNPEPLANKLVDAIWIAHCERKDFDVTKWADTLDPDEQNNIMF